MQKIFFFIAIITLAACGNAEQGKKLPFLGEREFVERSESGKTVTDTILHSIPDFSFTDQNGDTITQDFVQNKIYLVDFFFVACPTICPRVKKNMLKAYEKIKNDPNIVILSHTIDPRHDTTAALKAYADKLHLSGKTWHFLTGDRDSLYKMAGLYLVAAQEEKTAEGGFTHSGNVMLIDKNRHIRGYYDGLKEEQITGNLMRDIAILKAEH
jgi:protein SCO1